MRRALVVIAIVAGILFPATIAHAHSALTGSDPKEKAKLTEAPTTIQLRFSEPPISGDNLVVKDGCGVDVVTSADVDEGNIVAELREGQPGKWRVSSRVISAVDGHETTDGFRFTVRGQADCTKETAGPGRGPSEDEGSVVPLVLGLGGITALVAVGAFFLRRST